jgi:hypothetical protein
MSRLKITTFGTDCEGILLQGDPRKPEPIHTQIVFPGGKIEVTRTTDGDYWAHISRDCERSGFFVPSRDVEGEFTAARLDMGDKSTSQAILGDFANPTLYHVGIRIGTREKTKA